MSDRPPFFLDMLVFRVGTTQCTASPCGMLFLPNAERPVFPGQHRVLCRSDMVPAKLCNETASKCHFHTSLAQARSDIYIVGGVASPANRIAGQELASPPYMRLIPKIWLVIRFGYGSAKPPLVGCLDLTRSMCRVDACCMQQHR